MGWLWKEALQEADLTSPPTDADREYQRRISDDSTPLTSADVIPMHERYDPSEDAEEIERLSLRLKSIHHEQNELAKRYRDELKALDDDEAETNRQIAEHHGRMQQWVNRYRPMASEGTE